MRYKGLTIVLFAVVTFGFIFGFLNYHKKLDAMLGKEIVQASTGDFTVSPPDPDKEGKASSDTDEEVIVPSLEGLTKEEAERELEELGLVPEPKEEYSDASEKDKVFMQFPSEGTSALAGTKVSFSVSLGINETPAVEEQIIVPNLIGMAKEAAENKLKDAGFNVGYEYNPSEHYDEGFVYSQNYKVGAQVSKGTQVTIRISTGR